MEAKRHTNKSAKKSTMIDRCRAATSSQTAMNKIGAIKYGKETRKKQLPNKHTFVHSFWMKFSMKDEKCSAVASQWDCCMKLKL